MSAIPRPPRSLIALAAVFALIVFADSSWRWWTFQYETFDLAFYVQALWLALRGGWQVSLLDVPLLGNHAEPIVFLAAPLFALFPHPMLLVALQTLALATMPFTGWRIAQRLGHDAPTSLLLAVATILMPATGFVALHEFHPEALAAPLLLLLIEARLAKRLGRFWLWFAAALACKENVALMLIGYCVVQALLDWKRNRRWQWQWNVGPLMLAAGWLGLYAKALSPALNGGKVDYLELYSHLGQSGPEIIGHFFTKPGVALGAVAHAVSSGSLVWALLLPLLGLPLLRPRWLFIAAPLLLQHLLSWRVSEWSVRYHYAAPLIPLLWVASAEALTRLPSKRSLAWLMVAACFAGQCWLGPGRAVVGHFDNLEGKLRDRDLKAALLSEVSPRESVTAPLPYLSHLATRKEIYSLHHILKGLKTLSRAEFDAPPPTDVVIVDFEDAATFNAPAGYYHPKMRTVDGRIIPSSDQLLREFLSRVSWKAQAQNSFHVFKQGTSLPASNVETDPVSVSDQTILTGWRLASQGRSALIELSWELGTGIEIFPWVRIIAKHEKGGWSVTKGLCAPSVETGKVTERWTIRVPDGVVAGSYELALLFFDNASGSWAGRQPPRGEANLCLVPIGRIEVK